MLLNGGLTRLDSQRLKRVPFGNIMIPNGTDADRQVVLVSIESTERVLSAYLEGHGANAVAEDAVYTVMGSGYQVRGREAIGQFLDSFYTKIFDAGAELQNVLVGDGRAVVEGFVVGSHLADFAGVPASGKQVRVPLCVSYEMTNDQITAARIYFETDALRLQVSQP